MNKIYVLLGDMTFLEEVNDGEYTAIIHRIDEIKSFDTKEEALDYGEETISNGKYDSYLVPQVYGGGIEISED
jgi:hypothetical protein